MIGYVLVFALVTATIASVFAVGMTGLEDRRNAERVENVERAFDVFDDNLRDIQRYEDPSRATEMRLSGGSLTLEETTTVTLEYTNATGVQVDQRVNSSRLVYANGDTTVAYEAGAWFRSDGGESVMRSSPRFVADDGRTVLPVVQLRHENGPRSVDGDGTVQVSTTKGGDQNYQYPLNGSSKIDEIRIESPYADAWERYFKGSDAFIDVDRPNDGEVVAAIEHDETVYLRATRVYVSLRR